MKRLFDILLSGLGLLILSPVFIIVSFWIKCDSKGSVFYKQLRVGKNNRDFYLYKFRSMAVGADKKGWITIGGKDPRVTKSGYYLRKYKLDELPQLLNVFKGDMSLVGPRPEVRKYVNLYTSEQMQVLHVRPGITDLASIQYRNENELLSNVSDPEKYYIETIMQDKLRLNLEYIQKRSLLFDFKLIIKTIMAVVN